MREHHRSVDKFTGRREERALDGLVEFAFQLARHRWTGQQVVDASVRVSNGQHPVVGHGAVLDLAIGELSAAWEHAAQHDREFVVDQIDMLGDVQHPLLHVARSRRAFASVVPARRAPADGARSLLARSCPRPDSCTIVARRPVPVLQPPKTRHQKVQLSRTFVPSVWTVWPFTLTRPARMISSLARREATPDSDRNFWRRMGTANGKA